MSKEEFMQNLCPLIEEGPLKEWACFLMSVVWDALDEPFSPEEIKKQLEFERVFFLAVLYTLRSTKLYTPEAEEIKNRLYEYLRFLSDDLPAFVMQSAQSYLSIYGSRIKDMPYKAIFHRWRNIADLSFVDEKVLQKHNLIKNLWHPLFISMNF